MSGHVRQPTRCRKAVRQASQRALPAVPVVPLAKGTLKIPEKVFSCVIKIYWDHWGQWDQGLVSMGYWSQSSSLNGDFRDQYARARTKILSHVSRRRGGGVATRGARAAGNPARDRIPQ
jgi:hypothetical protein